MTREEIIDAIEDEQIEIANLIKCIQFSINGSRGLAEEILRRLEARGLVVICKEDVK